MEDFSLDKLSEKQLLRLAKYYKVEIDKSKSVLEQVKKHLDVKADGSIVRKEHIEGGRNSLNSKLTLSGSGARSIFYKVI